MDAILSEFIAHTSADPGLARDLLECHGWDMQSALSAFYVLKGITSSSLTDSSKIQLFPGGVKCSGGKKEQGYSSSPQLSPKATISRKGSISELDDGSSKRLSRGISRATDNVNLVSKARNKFAKDFRTSGHETSQLQVGFETPVYTFTLPDLSIYPEDFREFLEHDLIETSTLVALENAGRLNWWGEKTCQRLWPLATTGDGNCLLHAASLGMWGFHDRLLTLRKALHNLLANSTFTEAFYRRWRWQTAVLNKEAGLVYCEEEWRREWKSLLKMASTEPRLHPSQKTDSVESSAGALSTVMEDEVLSDVYESLEEFHVLALAHVLRRPIIVIADTVLKDVTGEPFAPIPFGGIYLPLECPPAECLRSPLCLTYDAAHFSALVAMEKETYADKTPHPPVAIPLVDPEHRLLPVQFAVDPGIEVQWGEDENDAGVISKLTLNDRDRLGLLNEYLDVVEIPVLDSITQDSADILEDDAASNGTDTDRRSAAGSFDSDDSVADFVSMPSSDGLLTQHRNKAARQLQNVAKQFGNIGKSMGRKIKKNFGSITRRSGFVKGTSGSPSCDSLKYRRSKEAVAMKSSVSGIVGAPDIIIAAVIHTDHRHEYQEEMIRNYLNSARCRFLKNKEAKVKQERGEHKIEVGSYSNHCINPGCSMYGTPSTCYMCSRCYGKQKMQEKELVTNKSNAVVNQGSKSNNTVSSEQCTCQNTNHEHNSVATEVSSGAKLSIKGDCTTNKPKQIVKNSHFVSEPNDSSNSAAVSSSPSKASMPVKVHITNN